MKNAITQLTDEELVLRIIDGQDSLFSEIVRRYSKRLLLFTYPKLPTRQDAEDVVQETFVKAWLNLGSYNNKYCLSTWLFTIAYRQAMTQLRGIRRRSADIVYDQKDYPCPCEIIEKQEDADGLWSAAKSLKRDQYDALWLKYKQDMPSSEIARVMGKTSVHVRVLLHRARTNLAEHLQRSTDIGLRNKVSSTAMQDKVACG